MSWHPRVHKHVLLLKSLRKHQSHSKYCNFKQYNLLYNDENKQCVTVPSFFFPPPSLAPLSGLLLTATVTEAAAAANHRVDI